MTAALDWPVAHGGAAVVTRDDLQQLWVPGTGPETTWAIASVTKLLTTMATLAACDAGHVDLDQPGDEEVAVGVSDRDFEDGRWAMRTWPAWSDGLRSARDTL